MVVAALYALAMLVVGVSSTVHASSPHQFIVATGLAQPGVAQQPEPHRLMDCGAPASGDHSAPARQCCAACIFAAVVRQDGPPATNLAYVLGVEQEFETETFSGHNYDLGPADTRSRAPPVLG